MNLSEIGKIAEKFWYEIPQHFSFVELGAFIVMPDHVHGIIIINRNDDGVGYDALHGTNVRSPNLGVIINQYKRICTINARKINIDFGWQTRFYDHIIRNDESFQRISDYINNNPAKWKDDENIITNDKT